MGKHLYMRDHINTISNYIGIHYIVHTTHCSALAHFCSYIPTRVFEYIIIICIQGVYRFLNPVPPALGKNLSKIVSG